MNEWRKPSEQPDEYASVWIAWRVGENIRYAGGTYRDEYFYPYYDAKYPAIALVNVLGWMPLPLWEEETE